MKKDSPSNEQIVNSWFELARILGILAGLFFVGAGLHASSYNGIQNNPQLTFEVCSYMYEHPELNSENLTFGECLTLFDMGVSDSIENESVITYLFLFLGFLIAMDSLFIWLIGRKKMLNSSFMDVHWAVFLLIVNISAILLFWFLFLSPLSQMTQRRVTLGNKTFNLPDKVNLHLFS
jgi:hypothetical protein